MNVRNADSSDAEVIAEIYNYYVQNTIITFEQEPVSVERMANRITDISSKYPFVVLEDHTSVIGYAYVTEWKTRSAYRFSGEITIYLAKDQTGQGLGSILFPALLNEIKKTNLHSIVGGIALPNPASIALHEKYGFKKIGCFEEIGFKFGQWIDVGYWELNLPIRG
jgi:L-amino acid N-acyltransferase YncA